MLLERGGSEIRVAAGADSTILVLSGVPIPEPIAGYGPFVMNTRQEIETAMDDFRLGKFGQMPPLEGRSAPDAGVQPVQVPAPVRPGEVDTAQFDLCGKNFGA